MADRNDSSHAAPDSTASEAAAFQASWVLPMDAEPIRDGIVEVRAGEIQAVQQPAGYRGPPPVDLNSLVGSDAILVPGLIKPHTHLEFSSLDQPLGDPNSPITDWTPKVIGWRRERDAHEDGLAKKTAATQAGLAESLRHGVVAIGEICTPKWSAEMIDCSPSPAVVAFLELIALQPAQNEPARQLAFDHLRDRDRSRGLSPHAPYTVNLELLEDAVDVSERTGAPLQMHLAETQEELEFIATNQGPFREMLERVGVWETADLPVGLSAFRYLERLSKATRCVIAHGNYLKPDEIQFLAEHRDSMAVAFCPRTHAFFGHSNHPLPDLRAAGATLALGTDSRASNPDLSVLAEVKHVANSGLASPREASEMATVGGAAALNLTDLGAIAKGKRSALTVLAAAEQSDSPYDAIVDDQTTVAGMILNGQFLVAIE